MLCFCNKDVWDKAGTHRCGQDSPHLKDPIALPPLVNGQACISGSLDAGLWLSLSCPKEMPWVNPWRLLPREDAGQWNELSAVKSIVYTVRMVLEEMRQEVGGCYSLTVKYPGRLTCWRLDFSCWCHWGVGWWLLRDPVQVFSTSPLLPMAGAAVLHMVPHLDSPRLASSSQLGEFNCLIEMLLLFERILRNQR